MLNRREFLASTAVAAAQPAQRPNILLFMTDQETALVPGPANTPNRRRLEAGGVRFANAFCNTPQCSAARSSLLTGLEPNHTGVLTNVDGGSLGKSLSPSLPTVGSVFRAAGYKTGYFGKWHLGNEKAGLEPFGFETYKPGRDEAVSRQAAAWIREQTSPWLAWVSVLNPHDIYTFEREAGGLAVRSGVKPPSTGSADLASRPPAQLQFNTKDQGRFSLDYKPEDWLRYRTYYLQLMEKADACLGTVLAAIPDLDSTVVAYIADHGDAQGEHGLPFKGPFMYEPLIRIPFVLRAPRRMQPALREDLVTQTDVAPTLASLAGLQWPAKIDGIDLAKGSSGRDAVFLEYYSKQKWVVPIRTIRTRRWKLNWYDSGDKELYDLQVDPIEARNLAGAPEAAQVRQELEARLDRWRKPMTVGKS